MALPSSHHRPAEPEEFSLFLRLSERPGVLLEGCISILGTERAPGGYTIYRVVFKVYTRYRCSYRYYRCKHLHALKQYTNWL